MSNGCEVPPRQSFADEAFAATADAFAQEQGNWELAVRSAIAALFDFLADRPDQTMACIVGDWGARPDALERLDQTIDRFAELLRPGFAAASVPPPPVIAEAIGGGIYELVRTHVLERRLEDLPGAIPNATVLALAPFMGVDEAVQLAGSS